MQVGSNDILFHYISMEEKAATLELEYQLKETVDALKLEQACEKALRTFPFWRLRPYRNKENYLVFKENLAKVPVMKEDGTKLHLGTDETNGYMFRVAYDDCVIRLVGFHGLSDARGVIAFGNTLMYYYATLLGYSISDEGVYTEENIQSDATIYETIMERYQEEGVVACEPPKKPEKILGISEDCIYSSTKQTKFYQLKWKNKEMLQFVKGVSGTPVTVFCAIFGQILYSIYGQEDEEKVVCFEVPVDMRSRLNSRAQSNFTLNVTMVYERAWMELSLEEQVKRLREQLNERTKLEHLMFSAEMTNGFIRFLTSMPVTDERLKQMKSSNDSAQIQRTLLFTNVGQLKLPLGMEELVSGVEFYITNLEATPAYLPISIGDCGMLKIFQNYESKEVLEAFVKKMKEYDIRVELEDRGCFISDIVNPDLYEEES